MSSWRYFSASSLGKKSKSVFPLISSSVVPELGAELLVGEREAAFEVLAQDHLGDRLDQRVIEDLGLRAGRARPDAARRPTVLRSENRRVCRYPPPPEPERRPPSSQAPRARRPPTSSERRRRSASASDDEQARSPVDGDDATRIKACLSGEFIEPHDAVLARRGQDGLAEGDRLQVVAARRCRARSPVSRARSKPPMVPAKASGNQASGQRGRCQAPCVADRRIVDRAGDALGPAGPADRAQGQPFGPLEPPADCDLGRGPLARGPGPDVVPAPRPGRRRRTRGCRG